MWMARTPTRRAAGTTVRRMRDLPIKVEKPSYAEVL
jgi:hypothetical protein